MSRCETGVKEQKGEGKYRMVGFGRDDIGK